MTWKACGGLLSLNMPGGTEENHENFGHYSTCHGRQLNWLRRERKDMKEDMLDNVRKRFITLALMTLSFVCRMVFVGEVNIAQCPTHYMDSVQHIISYCNSQPKLMRMPWIVNTMGFNKGQEQCCKHQYALFLSTNTRICHLFSLKISYISYF
jgi:hypothetical protein